MIEDTRKRGGATIPFVLEEDLLTNPFLRANDAEIRANIGMSGESYADLDVFTEIRKMKDGF